MEILRLPASEVVEFTTSVGTASAVYTLSYEDLDTGEVFSASATSTGAKRVTFQLDDRYLRYTGTIEATLYDSLQRQVQNFGIDVVRPYCDLDQVQAALGITPGTAQIHERAARKIIEAQLNMKFGLQRARREAVGTGTDYLPMPDKIQRIFTITENGETVFDYEDEDLDAGYEISVDGTSIVRTDDEDSLEYQVVWYTRLQDTSFPSGSNYVVDGEFGFRVIPGDIQEACELLMQDIENGNMTYFMGNISEFDNREFKIKYSGGTQQGTGNSIVDSILRNYRRPIYMGVL